MPLRTTLPFVPLPRLVLAPVLAPAPAAPCCCLASMRAWILACISAILAAENFRLMVALLSQTHPQRRRRAGVAGSCAPSALNCSRAHELVQVLLPGHLAIWEPCAGATRSYEGSAQHTATENRLHQDHPQHAPSTGHPVGRYTRLLLALRAATIYYATDRPEHWVLHQPRTTAALHVALTPRPPCRPW